MLRRYWLVLVVIAVLVIAGVGISYFYSQTNDGLRLISPQGGESYQIGDEIHFMWSTGNLPEGAYIAISLVDGPTPGHISINSPGKTEDRWFAKRIAVSDFTKALVPGEYKIKLVAYDNGPCANIVGECTPGTIPAKVIGESTLDVPIIIN